MLLALAVVALAPSLGVAQYTPKWHVGDWWVVRTFEESEMGYGGWVSCDIRYDVARIEKVNKRDCFVIETRYQGLHGELSEIPGVFYVRADDWLVVRQAVTITRDNKPLPPVITDRPLGLFGPFGGEPRLPRFPLEPGNRDTSFELKKRDEFSAWLREISGVADSSLIGRFLREGDSAGGRVVRPTGTVYQVRNELGGNLEPSPYGGERRIVRSLQFWSEDMPWRVCEELVQYDGPKPIRRVLERSWLVAVGHKKK